jgi:hypothetical protein
MIEFIAELGHFILGFIITFFGGLYLMGYMDE